MPEPTPVKEFREFPGMFSDFSPLTVPPGGSIHQVNVMSIRPGTLSNRKGLRALTYDDDGTKPIEHNSSEFDIGQFN